MSSAPSYKVLIFLKRRPGMSVADFRAYYEENHAKLCAGYMVGAQRYQRRYIEPMVDARTGVADELPFDVITELWFDDPAIFKQVVAISERGELPPEILEDEYRLFDRTKSRFVTLVECETDLAAVGAANT
ncbi:EthD domain-containing protein [Phenylobacterium sp. LjRoot225]|uniref:EthD domain-containing protein n=1 Tax=Phenylobacterium sp. LjRoot225 TaxID=3342285 RepID=UPI003ED15F30